MYDFSTFVVFFVSILDISMLAIDPSILDERNIQAINQMLKHTSETDDIIWIIRQALILVVVVIIVLIVFKYKYHSNLNITKDRSGQNNNQNTSHSKQFYETFAEKDNLNPLNDIQKSSKKSSHSKEIHHCKNLYFSKNYFAVIDYCQKLTYLHIDDPAYVITTLYLAKSFDKTNQFEHALSTYRHLLEITNKCPTIESDIKLIIDKKVNFDKKFNSG